MICLSTVHSVTAVTTFSTFGKSNFTHLTTNVMFLGQRFAILAMFLNGFPYLQNKLVQCFRWTL